MKKRLQNHVVSMTVAITSATALMSFGILGQTQDSAAASPPRTQADVEEKTVVIRSACDRRKAMTAAPTAPGIGSLTLQPLSGKTDQQFKLFGAGGNLQLSNVATGLLVTPYMLNSGASVDLAYGIGVEASNWKVKFVRRGLVEFTPLFGDDLRLDLKYADVTPGTPFHLWTPNSSCAQRFALDVIELPTPTTIPTTIPTSTSPATTTPSPSTVVIAPPEVTVSPITGPTSTTPATPAPATTVPEATIASTVVTTTIAQEPTTLPAATTIATTTVALSTASGISAQRWARLEGNLSVDSVDKILGQAETARQAGADTVMFADAKANLWFASPQLAADWLPKMKSLVAGVRAKGMKFILQTAPTGYCTPVLFQDPNLTTGYPLVDVPVAVRNGRLVPEQTATIPNGGLEDSTDSKLANWGTQDKPGVATISDTAIRHEGNASLRFEGLNSPDKQARIFTTVSVKPFQQYSLRFWAKTEGLSADYIGPYIVSATNSSRKLTAQHYSYLGTGNRDYINSPKNLTKDWTEMIIPFNSEAETDVTIAVGVWGAKAGKLWVDDLRLESTPLLNIVRRNNLPLTMKSAADGRAIQEGNDVSAVIDPQLGQSFYPGNFDTYHDAPVISVSNGSSLNEGDRVLISGYHAQVTTVGQIGCSWHDPKLLNILKEIHVQAAQNIGADGYLIDIEEIRTGGWEPADAAYGSSAASLSAHAQRVLSDAAAVTGKPIYVWSDMFDPKQNAVSTFYSVKGSLDGSWMGLDPNAATIVNWKDGDESTLAAESVKHFADLKFKQVIAGYYDRDVATNYTNWQAAIKNQPGIVGSMYTTFTSNFADIAAFGQLWWR